MIQLKVNGAQQSFDGEPEMPLLWYLRDVLGLTGSLKSFPTARAECLRSRVRSARSRFTLW